MNQANGEPPADAPAVNPLQSVFAGPSRVGAILAGWALLGLAVLVGVEVILRKVFSASLQGADELGGYAVAVVAAFGFGWTLLERAHIRIDIFVGILPRAVRLALDVLSLAAIATFAVFMAWRSAVALQESIEFQSLSGTPLMTPLWWPQSIWVAGLIVFAIIAAAAFIHAVWLIATDPARLDRWYGPRSLNDELEEEKKSLRERGVGDPQADRTS
ncbi:MAG: TRAP transporter small permease [Devosia sp.]